MAPPTYEEIRRAPKALLHDHLDGGLRPATIVELAAAFDHWLPADEPRALAAWFREAASSGSLERYLQTFAHTVAVMQAPEALHRVAAECAYDLATDGVVYAEVRFAPEQHLERGRDLPGVVEAVLAGFAAGSATAPVRWRSRSWPCGTATRAWSASTSPVPRPATRPPGTWTPSSTCSGRTSTSPSMRARRSGCRRSGRRSSGAAPTGWDMGCASSMTSRPRRAASAGSRPTCGTSGSRWSCARRPTCRPARRRRSGSIPSGCCATCASG